MRSATDCSDTPSHSLSSAPSSAPHCVVLSGFGPHRVPVGSFVRFVLQVRCDTDVFGPLRLRLHVSADDSTAETVVHPASTSSSEMDPVSQPSVITSGSLSPTLPVLATHHSLSHAFAVCCLAKGRFVYRIHCTTVDDSEHGSAVEEEGASTRFERLHNFIDSTRPNGHSTARGGRPASDSDGHRRGLAHDDRFLSHTFSCLQRLVIEAVV